MTTSSLYPGGLDSDANLPRVDVGTVLAPSLWNNLTDAVEAIETFVGVIPGDWLDTDTVVGKVVAALAGGGGGSGSGGPGFAGLTTPPAAASLTWVHQNGAVAADIGSVLSLKLGGTLNEPSCLVKSATAPYDFKVGFNYVMNPNDGGGVGIAITDGTKIVQFGIGSPGGTAMAHILVNEWSTPTAYSSTPFDGHFPASWPYVWLRVANDSTHRTYYFSPDGQYWVQVYQESATALTTETEVGVMVAPNSSAYDTVMDVFSWDGV